MTIYIDIIFLENLFMNFIILFATGIILKTKFKIFRSLLASALGGIYAIILYTSKMQIYSNIFLKIILSLSMVEIAFNLKTIKSFFKHLVIFYLTSFTFGGVAFALIYFVKPRNILFKNGKLVGVYPMKMILIGGIIGFIIIVFSFKNIKKRFTKEDILCKIIIEINNEAITVEAIIDTGNFLRDPISKSPVIVVNKEALRQILPDKILDNTKDIIEGKNIEIDEYIGKIRIIPFSSIGKENGILLGIKANQTVIEYQEVVKSLENAIIGIYDGKLSKNNQYQALIGLEAVEGGKNNEYFENIKI